MDDVCVYGVDVPGVEGKAGMAVMSDPQGKVSSCYCCLINFDVFTSVSNNVHYLRFKKHITLF